MALLVAGTAMLIGANFLFLMNFDEDRRREIESQIREQLGRDADSGSDLDDDDATDHEPDSSERDSDEDRGTQRRLRPPPYQQQPPKQQHQHQPPQQSHPPAQHIRLVPIVHLPNGGGGSASNSRTGSLERQPPRPALVQISFASVHATCSSPGAGSQSTELRATLITRRVLPERPVSAELNQLGAASCDAERNPSVSSHSDTAPRYEELIGFCKEVPNTRNYRYTRKIEMSCAFNKFFIFLKQ